MSVLDYLIGRIGLGVNPQTGERVRIKKTPSDDWGNTYEVIEEKDRATGTWKRTGTVPGSTSGGHY